MNSKPQFLGLVCLPFEATTSFLRGTAQGPEAILGELQVMDDFDFLLAKEPLRGVSRRIVRAHDDTLWNPEIQASIAERAVDSVLAEGGFPLCLGGEHAVTLGPVRSLLKGGELGVVQIDAHGDLRNSYQGSEFSHACIMRRVSELGCQLVSLGVRTMCREEADYLASNDHIQQVDGRTMASTRDWYSLIDELPNRVYLTVDMDGFDPCEAPAVGTPEPGGPDWTAVTDLLFYLFKTKNVVAADIVELMPLPGEFATIRLAARLTSLLTGLKFKA